MQAELRPHYDSDDVDSSEDKYVFSESFDSEEDILEEDLRERTNKQEVRDSDEEVPAQVMPAVDLTGKDGTVRRPTPPTATA